MSLTTEKVLTPPKPTARVAGTVSLVALMAVGIKLSFLAPKGQHQSGAAVGRGLVGLPSWGRWALQRQDEGLASRLTQPFDAKWIVRWRRRVLPPSSPQRPFAGRGTRRRKVW